MTLFVCALLGAGALLMVSAFEDSSISDTFNEILKGQSAGSAVSTSANSISSLPGTQSSQSSVTGQGTRAVAL